jgi:hypothetical protein
VEHVTGIRENCMQIKFYKENLKERDNSENLEVYGSKILK